MGMKAEEKSEVKIPEIKRGKPIFALGFEIISNFWIPKNGPLEEQRGRVVKPGERGYDELKNTMVGYVDLTAAHAPQDSLWRRVQFPETGKG